MGILGASLVAGLLGWAVLWSRRGTCPRPGPAYAEPSLGQMIYP